MLHYVVKFELRFEISDQGGSDIVDRLLTEIPSILHFGRSNAFLQKLSA